MISCVFNIVWLLASLFFVHISITGAGFLFVDAEILR